MPQVEIDIDKLRIDLENYYMSGFAATGLGVAFIEASELENASDERIVEIAEKIGFDLKKYII